MVKPRSQYVKAFVSRGSRPDNRRIYVSARLDDWDERRCDIAIRGQLMVVRPGTEYSCVGKQFAGRGAAINQISMPTDVRDRQPMTTCGYRVEGRVLVIRLPDWHPQDTRRGDVSGFIMPDPPLALVPTIITAPVAPVLPEMKPLEPGTPEWRDRIVRVTYHTAKAAAEAEGFRFHDWRDLQRYNEKRRARGDAQFAIVAPQRWAA